MKYTFSFVVFVCLFVLVSCSSGQTSAVLEEKRLQKTLIDSLQKRIQATANKGLDKKLAAEEITACLRYIKMFSEDSLCANYLFRVQKLSRGVGDYSSALNSIQIIINSYPDFKQMPECVFLRGFFCQEYFNDTLSAKLHYQTFISKYPKHPLVKEAKILMKLVGKTNDEILEGFK